MNGAARLLLSHAGSDDEAMAWGWLLHRSRNVPSVPGLQPFRTSDAVSRPKSFIVCQFTYSEYDEWDCPVPTRLILNDGVTVCSLTMDDLSSGYTLLMDRLLSKSNRGKLLCFLDGARMAFHVLLRHFGPMLLEDGFTVCPLSSTTSIRAVILRKDKHRWTLTDAGLMTGLSDISDSEVHRDIDASIGPSDVPLSSLYQAIDALQNWTAERFGVGYSITLASMSVRAAKRQLPNDGWLWPTSTLLETMCRDGGGYRGGLIFSRPYAGRAWEVDLNRAYTWALTQPIPIRWGIGPAVIDGCERPGLYLCRVRGASRHSAYLSVWRGPKSGFVPGYWRNGECLALLASVEFAGLRALGLTVRPSWGMVALAHTTLRDFARTLWLCRGEYGRGSPQDTIAKSLGNALYGKFGESPKRVSRLYATADPGTGYQPAITPWGDEIPDMWLGETTRYASTQHVDVATWITAYVRNQMYLGLAWLDDAGISVLSAYVDCLVTDNDPAGALSLSDDTLGSWRLADYNDHVVICSDHAWRFGDHVKVAGSQVSEPGVIDELYEQGHVAITERRLQAPWMGPAMWVETGRVLRMPATVTE